jgi:hypothetical protein
MPNDDELPPGTDAEDWANGKILYVRYSHSEPDGPVFVLRCPKCQCDQLRPQKPRIDEYGYEDQPELGDLIQCWECKHIFAVTGNCWKAQYER